MSIKAIVIVLAAIYVSGRVAFGIAHMRHSPLDLRALILNALWPLPVVVIPVYELLFSGLR